MEYSVGAYIRRLSTDQLEKFLQDYVDGNHKEDFTNVIGEVVHELALRKKKEKT